ncbi:hypothetical protein ACFXO9_26650 [Nocardia tengchongensis]|uniref:hypothetical protein n=1 Tax=Nocardia tengchongensis TaxID=2055889 RepID=UPI00369B0B27
MSERSPLPGIPVGLEPRAVTLIWEKDFSQFVSRVYGRPYQLGRQDGGLLKDSTVEFTVPAQEFEWSDPSVAEWLAALPPDDRDWQETLRWEREFHPGLEAIVNDLHARGLLPAGEYLLEVWW